MATLNAIDAKGKRVKVVYHSDMGLNGAWIGRKFYRDARAAVALPVVALSDRSEDREAAAEINRLMS